MFLYNIYTCKHTLPCLNIFVNVYSYSYHIKCQIYLLYVHRTKNQQTPWKHKPCKIYVYLKKTTLMTQPIGTQILPGNNSPPNKLIKDSVKRVGNHTQTETYSLIFFKNS